MRPILAFAILLLGLNNAAPEPEYSRLLRGTFHTDTEGGFTSLVEIESSTGRGDRRPMLIPASAEVIDNPTSTIDQTPAMPLPPSADINPDAEAPAAVNPDGAPSGGGDNNPAPQASLQDLCSALLTSAENNDLPVAFFANLIWQESRLRDDAVSPKGALGIAQMMPQVAAASGVQNPLDPLQALPASARLLRSLRDQFRNLGFVAAAYNAGAHRVAQWLEHGRTLPRETRGYVLNVTGRSVEEWRKTPLDDAALHFVRRLPCRDLPEFADLERAQREAHAEQEQARAEQQARLAQAEAQQHKVKEPPKAPQIDATAHAAPERVAERRHGRAALLRHPHLRIAEHEYRRGEHPAHESKQHLRRAAHEGHRRA
jgi:transglycosylase-like protein with SLT domain